MASHNVLFMVFIFLISLSILLLMGYTTAQPTYLDHFCYGRREYTTNSTFRTNLDLLFRSLSSANNSMINNGYQNATVGQNSDIVYGSLQCTGDILLEDCQVCVKIATKEIRRTDRCSNSTDAIIWYDMCMLRYSFLNYFNEMEVDPQFTSFDDDNVADADELRLILGGLLSGIAKSAVGNTVFPNFATGDTSYNNQKVNASVQCTADIPSSDCSECVDGAISELRNCCYGKLSARVLRPSCNIGYEIYPISQPTITPSPPR
ncbi:hypothetical protein MKX03_019392, partial [Papaver bracteatum]